MICIKNYTRFIVFVLEGAGLLYLFTLLLPNVFTLGNNLFTPLQSLFFVSFVWNFVLWHAGGQAKEFDIKLKSPMSMMLYYLAANFVTLWLLARFAVLTGFGVGSFLYVLILAFVANFVQYQSWQKMDSKKK